jgi:hypothetical protein
MTNVSILEEEVVVQRNVENVAVVVVARDVVWVIEADLRRERRHVVECEE